MAQAPEGASDRSLIERELEGIRQEIYSLVARVAPWEGRSPPVEDRSEGAITAVLMLMLGGVFIVGVASLIMGYMMQRRALDRERRRRRALTLSMRRRRDQLVAGGPILPALQPAALSRATHQASAPVTSLRRVRVAQKTRRRFRVWAPGATRGDAQVQDAERIRLVARTAQRAPSAPVELLEALAQLRGELLRLRGRPLPSAIRNNAVAGSKRASR